MERQNPTESSSSLTHEDVPHSRQSKIRFLLLALLVYVAFANEYAFNNPQALQQSMEEQLNISASQFQLFYSLYALPNIFTLLIIGYLCDLFGVRPSLIILSAGICLCQLLIAIGGYTRSYTTILVGRILFGICSQALFIPQASIIALWFQGSEQALAMGIGITFPELGNAFNSFMSPLIYDHSQNLGDPLMFSFGLCLLGFIVACVVAYIDKRAQLQDEQNDVLILDIQHESQSQQIHWSDIFKLRKEYWISTTICTLAMSMWIPFMDNVNSMFQHRFCYTQLSAGNVITIAYLVAVGVSLPLGVFVDTWGHRRLMAVVGIVVFLTAQLMMLAYPQCQGEEESGVIAVLVLQGIGYAFYATVLCATIPLVCKLSLLGTAFGLMEMFESFFQFLLPMFTGFMVEGASTPEIGYRFSSVMFTIVGCVGLAVSSALYWSFKEHYKKKLDRSSAQNLLAIARRQQTPNLVSSWSCTSQELLLRKKESSMLTHRIGSQTSLSQILIEVPSLYH